MPKPDTLGRTAWRMLTFEILPGVSVGPVAIGMNRSQVHSVLGQPELVVPGPDERHWFLSGLAVDFDPLGQVEFIEVARSPVFRALFRGTALREVPAGDAVKLVSREDSVDQNDPEFGYSFSFRTLRLSLWRGSIPDEGQAEFDDDGHSFESVAIWRVGYWDHVAG